jgi:secondary thiamine-phosphate synthase enzyme
MAAKPVQMQKYWAIAQMPVRKKNKRDKEKLMWIQKEIRLSPRSRGYHLVTQEILKQLPELNNIQVGMLNIFIKHTSASLTINENADPTVRQDFESFFNHAVPENEPYYKHLDEGSDDITAHLKASILGSSLNIPIAAGQLNIGVWQGVYLCEHRNHGGSRILVLTINGEV